MEYKPTNIEFLKFNTTMLPKRVDPKLPTIRFTRRGDNYLNPTAVNKLKLSVGLKIGLWQDSNTGQWHLAKNDEHGFPLKKVHRGDQLIFRCRQLSLTIFDSFDVPKEDNTWSFMLSIEPKILDKVHLHSIEVIPDTE